MKESCYNIQHAFWNESEKEDTNITFVKLKEHLRRRFQAFPARIWTLILMLVCTGITLGVLTASLNIVYVSDSDGQGQMVISYETDADSLMELSGIRAEIGDDVYYTAYSSNLASLSIQRAFDVVVVADGESRTASMAQGTVERALQLAGIVLNEHDYTVPSLNAELSEGASVSVHRVEYIDTVEYEAIPFETEYVYTSLFYKNRRRTMTVQNGSEGEKAITSRERWVDGEMESSQVVDITTTVQPKNTIIKAYAAGAPVSPRTGPDGTTNAPASYSRVLTGRCTGYYASSGRGASGLGLGYGTAAVDPAVIPYGTLMYIASTDGRFVYGYAIATDTGGALQNGSCLVDVFYGTYAESLMNSAITVNVYLVN